MKQIMKKGSYLIAVMALTMLFGMTVQAKEADTIKTGVYAGSIDLSGKNENQATAAVEAYVESLQDVEIILEAANDGEVTVTPGELGITWSNRDMIDQAMKLGTQGNIIERYKALKDLEHENYVFQIEFSFDVQLLSDILSQEAAKFDQKAVNTSLNRVDDQFRVIQGVPGYILDVETSIDKVIGYLEQEWNHEACRIPLDIIVEEPKGSAEELAQVQDLLGTFSTAFSGGGGRAANVERGSELLNGITLYPEEEISVFDKVEPFSVGNGYYMAASYLSGKVVDSLGGGICQVSTTLYNALLLAELEITERQNHSMIVGYVSPSADAAIADGAIKDLKFVNNTEAPIYIESYVKNNRITFNIYGKETRPEGRTVRYESEVLEVINPPADQINIDESQPIGYFVSEGSAYIGYKARLWKIVTENGQETRTQVNSSSYRMVPKSATVGVATDNPSAYEQIMAAIGTGNIEHVQNVIAIMTAPPADANGGAGVQ